MFKIFSFYIRDILVKKSTWIIIALACAIIGFINIQFGVLIEKSITQTGNFTQSYMYEVSKIIVIGLMTITLAIFLSLKYANVTSDVADSGLELLISSKPIARWKNQIAKILSMITSAFIFTFIISIFANGMFAIVVSSFDASNFMQYTMGYWMGTFIFSVFVTGLVMFFGSFLGKVLYSVIAIAIPALIFVVGQLATLGGNGSASDTMKSKIMRKTDGSFVRASIRQSYEDGVTDVTSEVTMNPTAWLSDMAQMFAPDNLQAKHYYMDSHQLDTNNMGVPSATSAMNKVGGKSGYEDDKGPNKWIIAYELKNSMPWLSASQVESFIKFAYMQFDEKDTSTEAVKYRKLLDVKKEMNTDLLRNLVRAAGALDTTNLIRENVYATYDQITDGLGEGLRFVLFKQMDKISIPGFEEAFKNSYKKSEIVSTLIGIWQSIYIMDILKDIERYTQAKGTPIDKLATMHISKFSKADVNCGESKTDEIPLCNPKSNLAGAKPSSGTTVSTGTGTGTVADPKASTAALWVDDTHLNYVFDNLLIGFMEQRFSKPEHYTDIQDKIEKSAPFLMKIDSTWTYEYDEATSEGNGAALMIILLGLGIVLTATGAFISSRKDVR